MSDKFLQGRTALVTGSTSGIGLAIASALAAAGADQDQRALIAPRMKPRIAAQKGRDLRARLQRQQLTRAKPAGVLFHHQFDKTSPHPRGQGGEPGQSGPFGQYAQQIPRLKPRKAAARQPLPD